MNSDIPENVTTCPGCWDAKCQHDDSCRRGFRVPKGFKLVPDPEPHRFQDYMRPSAACEACGRLAGDPIHVA